MSLQILSESVYVGLCLKIGTQQQVSFRRETADVKELFENQITRIDHSVTRKGGSQREGFQLEDSDEDYLIWSDDQRVFWDFLQMIDCNILRTAFIFCDSSESPPGYTLLWLPLGRAYRIVLSSCVEKKESCIFLALNTENALVLCEEHIQLCMVHVAVEHITMY